MSVQFKKSTKQDRRREEVLIGGLQLAARHGLEALSIGLLASELKMSRSGLFYYVKSLETFQIELIDFAAELFRRTVVEPVLYVPASVEKVRKFLTLWPGWADACAPRLSGGCPLVSFLFELDGREGALLDRVLYHIDRLDQFLAFLHQSCVAAGDFGRDSSEQEFVHDCWGYYLPILWMRQRRAKSISAGIISNRRETLIRKYRQADGKRGAR